MKVYYVEGYRGWFLVRAKTKQRARSAGVQEFGRGMVREVREATPEDVKAYASQKGNDAIEEVD